VYFDNAATTRVRGEVRDVIVSMMCENYGNPSSSHLMGRRAKAALDASRRQIAGALGALPEEITFTSGGTEADNWAVLGAAGALPGGGRHLITDLAEHEAVRKSAQLLERRGWDVTYLRPGKDGRITAESFAAALREDTALASVMLVNNETGALNPIADMTRELRRRGLETLFHTDAVQGFMKLPFTVKTLGADLVSVSAHKLHGPKGVGALYARKGVRLTPLLVGGAQEKEKRAGTEAVPAIAGFGEAVRLAGTEREANAESVRAVRELTIRLLREKLPGALILSPGDSPYILSLSLPRLRSEVLMNCLEADGIYVSKSSACKKGARSHVLEAMGLENEVIDGALRVSFSRYSTADEAAYFADRLSAAADRLGKVMR
jgi:cysteine desulfurase